MLISSYIHEKPVTVITYQPGDKLELVDAPEVDRKIKISSFAQDKVETPIIETLDFASYTISLDDSIPIRYLKVQSVMKEEVIKEAYFVLINIQAIGQVPLSEALASKQVIPSLSHWILFENNNSYLELNKEDLANVGRLELLCAFHSCFSNTAAENRKTFVPWLGGVVTAFVSPAVPLFARRLTINDFSDTFYNDESIDRTAAQFTKFQQISGI